MRTFASAVVGSLVLLSVANAAEPAVADPDSVLDQVIPDISFDVVGLNDALTVISQKTQLKIDVEWEELAKGGLAKATPVTARLRNVRVSKVLRTVLDSANAQGEKRFRSDSATYRLMPDGRIVVTTLRSQFAHTGETKDYAINDIIKAAGPKNEKQSEDFRKAIVELLKDTFVDDFRPPEPGEVNGTISLSGDTIAIFTHAEGHKRVKALLDAVRTARQPATQPR